MNSEKPEEEKRKVEATMITFSRVFHGVLKILFNGSSKFFWGLKGHDHDFLRLWP